MQALLFLVALCATKASAATLGEAVAGLCGPILDGLQLPGFSLLKAALDAASDIDVGGAFAMNISPCVVEKSNTSNLDSDTATTLSPTEQLTFMGGVEEVSLKELAGDVLAGTGSVMGPVNSATVTDVFACPDNKQIVLVAGAVLLPTALASAPTNAPEPVVPEPTTPEPSLPASGSKSSSIGMVTIVSLIAARFL